MFSRLRAPSARCRRQCLANAQPGMRKRLQIAMMAASATFFCPTLQAQANPPITPTQDESGHKIYVNDVSVPQVRRPLRTPQNRLVFWSSTSNTWKPVPHANVQAAKFAAAEVDQYLGKSETARNSSSAKGFTQRDVDIAIDRAASRHNVDPNLVRALVKVESNFNPNAVSRKGAMGLMQLMPQTARQLNLNNPFDPEQNVDAGVRHLKRLLDSYGGDVRLSLAAYNAGAGAVARNSGIPRYAETQNYVRRITSLYSGSLGSSYFVGATREPVRMQRDARGVLYISNTD